MFASPANCLRSPCIAHCSLATATVRLTAICNGSRDVTNCGVRIVMGGMCNGFAGATVTTDETSECDNRLVTDVSVAIGGQKPNGGQLQHR
jgi:hypothetical protein